MVLKLGRFLKAVSDGGEGSRQSSVIWTLKGVWRGGGREQPNDSQDLSMVIIEKNLITVPVFIKITVKSENMLATV